MIVTRSDSLHPSIEPRTSIVVAVHELIFHVRAAASTPAMANTHNRIVRPRAGLVDARGRTRIEELSSTFHRQSAKCTEGKERIVPDRLPDFELTASAEAGMRANVD